VVLKVPREDVTLTIRYMSPLVST